jgi:DNA polymerase V
MNAAIKFTPQTLRNTARYLPRVTNLNAPCGKPESTDELFIEWMDLNKELIPRPRSTYGLTAFGDSMHDEGIDSGDLLIVDRDAEPQADSIVIVELDGEYTVKKLARVGHRLWLVPGNKDFQPIEVGREQFCKVWGVVQWIIKRA